MLQGWKEYNELIKILGFAPPRETPIFEVATRQIAIDIIALDKKFGLNDSDYDPEKCTYRDKKNVSMNEYVTEKFGKRASELIEKII